MKVAVVYNIAPADLKVTKKKIRTDKLEFEPYFDVETSNDPTESYEHIAQALRDVGYDAYTLNILDDYNKFLQDYKQNSPDVIFNMVEIYKDRAYLEMSFACFLELMKVPYTGAPPLTLGTCIRKIKAKSIFKAFNINTPKFRIVKKVEDCENLDLSYPVIVKPSMEDASIGIEDESVVNDYESLIKRVEHVLDRFKQDVLLEEFINGRELNVAVLGDKNPKVLPISEIDFTNMPSHLNKIVSYQAKWDPLHIAYHTTLPICPSVLPEEVEKKAKDLALSAFQALGGRDYARVDIRLSKKNELFVLEVNPNPDLTEDAGFMRSARVAGYSYKRALKKIVDLAVARMNRENKENKFKHVEEFEEV